MIIFCGFATLFIRNKISKLDKFYKFLTPNLGEMYINTNTLHDRYYPSLTRSNKGAGNGGSHECGLKPEGPQDLSVSFQKPLCAVCMVREL